MEQFQNVAIFAKVHDPSCLGIAGQLIQWLRDMGCVPLLEPQLARHLNYPKVLTEGEIRDQAELVVVLGGGWHTYLCGAALQRQGRADPGGQPGKPRFSDGDHR